MVLGLRVPEAGLVKAHISLNTGPYVEHMTEIKADIAATPELPYLAVVAGAVMEVSKAIDTKKRPLVCADQLQLICRLFARFYTMYGEEKPYMDISSQAINSLA